MILAIRKWPSKYLKATAKPVQPEDNTAALAANMHETLARLGGIGLAAPQVGKLLRVFVVNHEDRKLTLVNPVILERSDEKSSELEGCLSLPGVASYVERSDIIEVEWTDEEGVEQAERFKHLFARVIQHENDHLNGVTIMTSGVPVIRGSKWSGRPK